MGSWYRRWDGIALFVLLSGLLWLRLSLAFDVPTLSFDSYLTVRQVESVLDTGTPIYRDALSVTGHHRIGSPFFFYLLAAGVWFTPLWYKLFPNLCMVLALVPVFFLAKKITKSPLVALFAVLLAGTGPLVFAHGLISASSSTLALCILISIIAMLSNPERHLGWFLGGAIILTFLHPLSFLLVLSLLVVLILLRIEGFGINRKVTELFVFTLFLSTWFLAVVYKRAFVTEGVRIIWQNLPPEYFQLSFSAVDGVSLLYGLGVLTFLFGVLGAYHVLFEERVKEAYGVIGASIAVAFALLLRVIPVELGMVVLSTLLAIMAGRGLQICGEYLRMTRTPWIVWPAGMFMIFLFVLTALLPTLSNARDALADAPTATDVIAYSSLREELPPNAVLLTSIKEAYFVQYIAGVRTLTDEDFLLVENSEELVSDIDAVYTSRFISPVLTRSEKLGMQYILFSQTTGRLYSRNEILFTDTGCIPKKEIAESLYLYKIICGGRNV